MTARSSFRLTICTAMLFGFASVAQAIPFVLTPASVIGGSGAYPANNWDGTAGGQFDGSKITNNNITEPVGGGGSGNEEWLGPQSGLNQYLVIDLGSQQMISQINLYNTHNGQYNDSGTQNFRIDASNSVTFVNSNVDYDLSGAVTTLLNGVLSDTSNQASIIPDQFFLNPGTSSYRYLRFVALDYRVGDVRVGLNELEAFYIIPAPEPSSCMLLGLGILGLVQHTHRRRNSQI